MTGAYLRVLRAGGWQSIEVEHLTKEERAEALAGRNHEELLRWLDLTCEELARIEPLLKSLETDGVIKRRTNHEP